MLKQFIEKEKIFITKKTFLSLSEIEYYFDSFLPILTCYIKLFQDPITSLLVENDDQIQTLFQFTKLFIENVENMFFVAP